MQRRPDLCPEPQKPDFLCRGQAYSLPYGKPLRVYGMAKAYRADIFRKNRPSLPRMQRRPDGGWGFQKPGFWVGGGGLRNRVS
ncbi:hypothetical protein [Planktothricoides raciborskii]|uniref:Uncharacterized protein n=1 Tax=Planktothricoides raciborskii FACHB-1370 TaxID=2949576 RepID=A0ABR8EJY1_9CYAN|nr:hypothetical protein [Planktothricoides raciborskii]MBD2546968.1 hypothetical protein [Planktothricoides raciborskii FACHB-1370]MBD2585491.1 hypothetical protein [Planktothricoides raciborskii FACHB-1261]